jgi:hypothetical protein
MSYSTGPGGYGDPSQGAGGPGHSSDAGGGYGQQAPSYGATSGLGLGQSKGLPFFLNLGVIALGVISFFLGFLSFAKENPDYNGSGGVFDKKSFNFFDNISLGVGVISLTVLLAAALITALAMLPKQDSHDAVVAGLSAAGFISLLFLMIGLTSAASAGIGLILILITSFLQSALAIAVLLFNAEIIKAPQPRQPNYGTYGYYGQGGYGQSQQPQSQPQQQYYGGAGSAPGAPPSYQPPPSQPQQQQQPPSQPNPQNPW